MATKLKPNGLHTAGIYSDMTVDGPEIGTLVVIVDRAKNLPNRKTIGKQNPYCAARLGKEAKKTETDHRGGQTPRWDQELRFTVHDSPDYYQLKVSVFNDDKKTDLIGETWVNLSEVVVPGGGQSDIWHNLNCKGKYAGEIRIEITYYDTRPKQEKPEKPRSNSVQQDAGREGVGGPRQQKAPIKRRPLPSDPITGAPPPAPAPAAIPEHVQTPPRGYPSPTAVPEHAQTPPRGYQAPPIAIPEHVQTPPRGYQTPPIAIPEHVHTPPRGYQTPPTAIPDHVQTPSRGYQSPSYISNQSPLQSVEYNTPPNRFTQPRAYEHNDSNAYGTSPGTMNSAPKSQQNRNDRYDNYDPMTRNDYSQSNGMDRYGDEEQSFSPQDQYNVPYELPPIDDFGSPPSDGGPPPPPPRHGSKQTSPLPSMNTYGSYDSPRDIHSSQPFDIPQREMHHRNSEQSYPLSGSYQAYSPPKAEDDFRSSQNGNGYQNSPPRDEDRFRTSQSGDGYQKPVPRHNSYDSRYNNYGSMQPTVEDVPESPATYDRRYDEVPSPAPLNLSGRGSAASGRNSVSSAPSHQYSSSSLGYASTNSSSLRDLSQTGTSVSSRTSYGNLPQSHQSRSESQDNLGDSPLDYGMPPVPPTLVAGMDPMIAKEISDRIYNEKRASFSTGSPRGRQHQDLPQYSNPTRPHPLSYHEAAAPFVPAAATYDERQSRIATNTTPTARSRGISPNPMGTVIRKSVSPSPSRGTGDGGGRRLSGIPFGPDSYNALNPVLSSSKSSNSLSAAYDTSEPDPDAKIIMHDGREIDPSDHIPESNYAPLLEPKGPKYASQQPDRNYRPRPTAPTTEQRRPLQKANRPQSMALSAPMYMNTATPEQTPPPTGRNRLQKKANRMSAQPTTHSSPLVPITSYQDNNSYQPRYQPRPNTADSLNENFAPSSYGGSPGYRGTVGPLVPAKVPIGLPPPQRKVSGDAWALLEEMKNIDLGSGRARRRNY